MDSKLGDRLCILAAALLFSTGGAAIKACALGGWQIASFRSAVAALALVALWPAARRRPTWRMVAVGASYAATMILFVSANKLTTAANTIFLQSTAPLYVLLLAPLLVHERARRVDLVAMGVIAGGLALFFVGAEPVRLTAPRPALGNALATASGVTWGLTLIGLRSLGRPGSEPDAPTHANAGIGAVVIGNALAFALALPFALGAGAPGLATTGPEDWLLLTYLGAIQIALAYALLTRGLRAVPAFEASLLILVEPALNPLWAWWLQGETPSAFALAGGALILGASIGRAWWARSAQRPAPVEPSIPSREDLP
jgi:drug/metabolite transporter (DMT)-like permease